MPVRRGAVEGERRCWRGPVEGEFRPWSRHEAEVRATSSTGVAPRRWLVLHMVVDDGTAEEMTELQKRDGWLLAAACLTLVLLAARAASASPISFSMTGHIVAVIDPTQVLDGTLVEGGQVEATYTVRFDDDGGVTVVFGDGQTGRRVPAGGRVSGGSYRAGSGTGGNLTFSAPCVTNIACNHLAAYVLILPLLAVDGVEQEFRMDLGGLEGSLFEPVPFWKRLGDFQTREFSWTFSVGNGTARIDGVVTGHEPVPEPSTILLLGSGLAGVAGRRRLSKRP